MTFSMAYNTGPAKWSDSRPSRATPALSSLAAPVCQPYTGGILLLGISNTPTWFHSHMQTPRPSSAVNLFCVVIGGLAVSMALTAIGQAPAQNDTQAATNTDGELRVQVVKTPDHAILPGAEVEIKTPDGRIWRRNRETWQPLKSDSNGVAVTRLPTGQYQVEPHYGMGWYPLERTTVDIAAGRTNTLEVAIRPPPAILGTVCDPSGNPVPNLPLNVVPPQKALQAITSDVNGRFSFAWNPYLYVESSQPPVLAGVDRSRNLCGTVPIDIKTTSVELKLRKGIIAIGRVEDPKGVGITNASVRLLPLADDLYGTEPVRTDPEGWYG